MRRSYLDRTLGLVVLHYCKLISAQMLMDFIALYINELEILETWQASNFGYKMDIGLKHVNSSLTYT